MREIIVKGRPATIADVEISPGKQVAIWVPAVLKRKLKMVEIGTYLEIEYLGRVMDTPLGKAHDFKVQKRA